MVADESIRNLVVAAQVLGIVRCLDSVTTFVPGGKFEFRRIQGHLLWSSMLHHCIRCLIGCVRLELLLAGIIEHGICRVVDHTRLVLVPLRVSQPVYVGGDPDSSVRDLRL